MSGTAQGKNTYKLIFEFNNDSPLFARLASSEIESGNYKTAEEILEKGIEKFPSYPTAKLLYSIALAYQGKIKEAVLSVESIKEFFNSPETLESYLNRISRIDRDQNSFTESTRYSFLPEEEAAKEETFEDKLSDIAEELKKAKISIRTTVAGDINPVQEKAPEKSIVSETMARILMLQEKYKEALAVYEELLQIEPDKKEYIEWKIAEVKKHLGIN